MEWLCPKTCRYREKRWDPKRLVGSGGMPSSHSATVTALAVAIGLQDGTGSSSFALAVVLATVVCTFPIGGSLISSFSLFIFLVIVLVFCVESEMS